MEIKKILEEKENPFFNRKEIIIDIESQTNPTKSETSQLLSEKFSVPVESIKIKNILGKFGSQSFKIVANIYSSREDKDKIERKTKKEIEQEKKELETKKAEEEKQTVQKEESTESSSQSKVPAQEQTENKQEEKKEETKEQELAKPDKEPTQKNKVEKEE